MKKFFSLVLALSLALCMGLSVVSAADSWGPNDVQMIPVLNLEGNFEKTNTHQSPLLYDSPSTTKSFAFKHLNNCLAKQNQTMTSAPIVLDGTELTYTGSADSLKAGVKLPVVYGGKVTLAANQKAAILHKKHDGTVEMLDAEVTYDAAENRTSFWATYTSLSPVYPVIYTVAAIETASSFDWDTVRAQVAAAPDGGSVVVDVKDEIAVPYHIWQVLDGRNVNLTLVRHGENFVFNGAALAKTSFNPNAGHNLTDLTGFVKNSAPAASNSGATSPSTGFAFPVAMAVAAAALGGSVYGLKKSK